MLLLDLCSTYIKNIDWFDWIRAHTLWFTWMSKHWIRIIANWIWVAKAFVSFFPTVSVSSTLFLFLSLTHPKPDCSKKRQNNNRLRNKKKLSMWIDEKCVRCEWLWCRWIRNDQYSGCSRAIRDDVRVFRLFERYGKWWAPVQRFVCHGVY